MLDVDLWCIFSNGEHELRLLVPFNIIEVLSSRMSRIGLKFYKTYDQHIIKLVLNFENIFFSALKFTD